jgi:hypothetical protein
MNCDWVRSNITLYAFDELGDADRAELEQHVTRCRDCAREAEAEKQLRRIMDLRPKLEPSATLLAECRLRLAEALEEMPAPQAATPGISRWTQWLSTPFAGLNLQWQAGMAVALLSVGFISGAFLSARGMHMPGSGGSDFTQASIAGVHSISARPDGKLDISLDTLQRQNISGSIDDPRIKQVLVSALGDYNSGVRLDSAELMKKAMENGGSPALTADPQVRAAFIASLRTDKNPAVRLTAIDALKGFESDPAVRDALLGALLSDSNSGVRMKAIEILASQKAPAGNNAAIVALQKLAEQDSNSYIRLKSADTLRKWNAPVEMY